MKARFYTLAIILLACIQVLSFVYLTQAVNNTNGISQKLKDNPPKIVYVQAKDGYTPVKGLDYFDGAKGLNAMSFSVTNNVIKEVPIIGPKGDNGADGKNGNDGKDAADIQYRMNDETGNFEFKKTTDSFWGVAISCDKFVDGCKE